ncbi:MAG: RidA family protein [Armatimonadetes bacterium]|nr:RidA family protein [Armatimonadota bacterium]
MTRQLISSGWRWEPVAGYSRAVRVGNMVFVSGTTATAPDGSIVGVDDMHAQAVQAFANIGRALEQAGASFADVVRTRIFVTDMTKWEPVVRVHGEIFKDIRPASTLVGVTGLVHPDMLVEIEVDAVIEA